jgi:hypothetical protein
MFRLPILISGPRAVPSEQTRMWIARWNGKRLTFVETGTEKSSRRTAPSRAEPQVNVLHASVPAHRHPPGPGHEWAFWSFVEATNPIKDTTPPPPPVRWGSYGGEREREAGEVLSFHAVPATPFRSSSPLRPHWYVSFHSHSLDFCLIFCGGVLGKQGPGLDFSRLIN